MVLKEKIYFIFKLLIFFWMLEENMFMVIRLSILIIFLLLVLFVWEMKNMLVLV